MARASYQDTALHYCVDDLPGASLPAARLQKILDCLQTGKPVTRLSLIFLQEQGLMALHGLATGGLPYERFRKLACPEQATRIKAAVAARVAWEADEQERKARARHAREQAEQQAKAARLARESDPKYIAKRRNQKLRARYKIAGYVEEDCFNRLMKILRRVDAGQRLSQEDFVWLSTVGEEYFSEALRAAYHQLEADCFASEFKKTRNLWAAVNASSHYRKCGRAPDADALLKTIRVERQKSTKLKSALCTTHGGVMRDLGIQTEALRLGEMAHAFSPDDYRPCTLLGAVHMELSNFTIGHEWYAKAIERGTTPDSVDQDLRNIFFRADRVRQKAMSEFLLDLDPIRYQWAKLKTKARKR